MENHKIIFILNKLRRQLYFIVMSTLQNDTIFAPTYLTKDSFIWKKSDWLNMFGFSLHAFINVIKRQKIEKLHLQKFSEKSPVAQSIL